MGDVVGSAAKLSNYGNKEYYDYETMLSATFYNNLKDDNKKWVSWNSSRNCYHTNIVDVVMNDWNKNN